MRKKVDLRGLSPPEPVVQTKRLLAEFEDGILDVIVDAGPSRDDILHFANFKKYRASVVAESSNAVRLRIIKGNPPPEEEPPRGEKETIRPQPQAEPPPGQETASVLMITSEGIGEDNRRLAVSLMVEVLRGLSTGPKKFSKLILINSGVSLACAGSAALETLQSLAQSGVEVLVSKESLDFLGLRPELNDVKPATAEQVARVLLAASRVVRL